MRERLAIGAGRVAGSLSRRVGRGGGTSIPGLIAGAISPGLVASFAGRLAGVVTVTGTNGKTTTAHLLSTALRSDGTHVVGNSAGSNLERGIVTTYVESEQLSASEREAGSIGVLEIDEAALPGLFTDLRPRVALFLNLFRDQLDRYGEVGSVLEGWRRMLSSAPPDATVVLNGDDPGIAQLAESYAGPVLAFGVADPGLDPIGTDHASDARFCRCGARLHHHAVFLGHLSDWYCATCDRRRPELAVRATRVSLEADGVSFDVEAGAERVGVRAPLAGMHSVYNLLAAVAATYALGRPLSEVTQALASTTPAFGRQERFTVEGRSVRVSLAKNPTGLNEVSRTLATIAEPFVLLAVLNDGVQDGQDVSWIYDADLELLREAPVTLVCAGDRAADLALRFALAGLEPAAVINDIPLALEHALALEPRTRPVEVVPTYTGMLRVREALAEIEGRGHYWESSS